MKIFNTLLKKKQDFVSINPQEVSMYVCGVTVYDECHLGHARAYVSFDIVRRYLEYKNFQVKYIQNFTDIDDKIINRALTLKNQSKDDSSLQSCVLELTTKYINSYFEVMDKLGIKRASLYPKATEHIGEMIDIILGLIKKGYAYEVDGDVFFEVQKYKEYGALSGRNIDELQAGQRVEINEKKRSPLDFVLWKKAKENEPFWESPWGNGRPGWHIECSAMSLKYLGEEFDIHGGGFDLVFPHHENEIAQSRCFTGKKFVHYWMHNGFLTIDKEKMSKSLGNFFTLKDIFLKFHPEIVRFFFISAHYRSPLDFHDEKLLSAKEQMERGYMMLKNIELKFILSDYKVNAEFFYEKYEDIKAIKEKFISGMDDDFNTAIAVACLFDLVNIANAILLLKKVTTDELDKLAAIENLFNEISNVLNIFKFRKHIISIDTDVKEELHKKIKQLLLERVDARKNKDWIAADKIRDTIKTLTDDIELEDTPKGTFVSTKY